MLSNIQHEQNVYVLSRFGCGRPGLVTRGMKLMLFVLPKADMKT